MIPAGFKERRWAVFDMGEAHVQDHAYFAAITQEMDNGGREALLYHLLNFDLSSPFGSYPRPLLCSISRSSR